MQDKLLTVFVLYPLTGLLILSVIVLIAGLLYGYDMQRGLFKNDNNKNKV